VVIDYFAIIIAFSSYVRVYITSFPAHPRAACDNNIHNPNLRVECVLVIFGKFFRDTRIVPGPFLLDSGAVVYLGIYICSFELRRYIV
jgi:hypothetical protein